MGAYDVAVFDVGVDGGKAIGCVAHDVDWAPSRLVVLDPDTHEETGELWQYGHFNAVVAFETPAGPRLGAFGINNSLRNLLAEPACNGPGTNFSIACLVDPTRLNGQTPPGVFADLDVFDCDWYVASLPRAIHIVRMDPVDYDGDGIDDVCIRTDGGQFYYVSFAGDFLGRAVMDSIRVPDPCVDLVFWNPVERRFEHRTPRSGEQ